MFSDHLKCYRKKQLASKKRRASSGHSLESGKAISLTSTTQVVVVESMQGTVLVTVVVPSVLRFVIFRRKVCKTTSDKTRIVDDKKGPITYPVYRDSRRSVRTAFETLKHYLA